MFYLCVQYRVFLTKGEVRAHPSPLSLLLSIHTAIILNNNLFFKIFILNFFFLLLEMRTVHKYVTHRLRLRLAECVDRNTAFSARGSSWSLGHFLNWRLRWNAHS